MEWAGLAVGNLNTGQTDRQNKRLSPKFLTVD
jgi:hypothetical protein